jgi:hypothetical protein
MDGYEYKNLHKFLQYKEFPVNYTTTEYTTNHNPLVVYRHLTTGGLWYNVYTTEYTTNHNPLVVYRNLTTGGLWYNVYTTEYTTNHFCILFLNCQINIHTVKLFPFFFSQHSLSNPANLSNGNLTRVYVINLN